MILRSNGQNIYPEELEQCLRQALSLDRAELPKYAQIESVELLRKQDPRQWK